MFYEVKLSPGECDLLVSLIGQPLERAATDGWAVESRAGSTLLSVIPEEFATPDAEHPHGDVERPRVKAGVQPLPPEHAKVVGQRLGVIRAVKVVSTLIGFSPVVDLPTEEIRPGVVLPASRGYGWVYYPPGQREQAEQELGTGALVDLDIAFELVADECPSLVAYTRGFFVQVSLQGLPSDAEWVGFGAYLRRALT